MANRTTLKDVTNLRSLSHGKILSRSPLKSHYLSNREGGLPSPAPAAAAVPAAALPVAPAPVPEKLSMLDKFRKSALGAWILAGVGGAKSYLGARYDFQDPQKLPGKSIYPMDPVTRIGLAGDWASGTYESEAVAVGMQTDDDGNTMTPDFTFHIGDVYYIGLQEEIEHSFAMKPGNDVVEWPRGSKGSFAMCGNHEMFSRGIPYVENLLPNLGFAANGQYTKGQGSSLFCLENDNWLLVGLDTGYNSVKWFVPYGLRDENIEWLKQCIFTAERKNKGVILFSHHQYFSRFEGDYMKFAQQLADINGFLAGREVLWLWGHEHRFSGYALNAGMGMALTVHGRCVGHSGMPVEILAPDTKKTGVPQLAFYDNRRNKYYADPTGMNGYCMLDFNGSALTLSYYDGIWIPKGQDWSMGASASEKILVETFGSQNGSVKLMQRQKITSDPDFIVTPVA